MYQKSEPTTARDPDFILPQGMLLKIYKRYIYQTCSIEIPKKSISVKAENGNIQNPTSETSLPQKKIMRSDKSNSIKSWNKNVLPPVCIICQKKDAYITEQVSTCSLLV